MAYVLLNDGLVINTENTDFWKNDGKVISENEGKKLEQAQALDCLKRLCNPDYPIYTVLRHVSASGMSRDIDIYTFKDNKKVYLSGYFAKAFNYRISKNGGLRVGGCGMDMGYHLVYILSSKLFNDGYVLRHEWL